MVHLAEFWTCAYLLLLALKGLHEAFGTFNKSQSFSHPGARILSCSCRHLILLLLPPTLNYVLSIDQMNL